jgi:hypothetical protein
MLLGVGDVHKMQAVDASIFYLIIQPLMLLDENLLEDNLDTTVSETPETADEADEDNSQTNEGEETVDPKELRHAQQQE